MFVVLEERATVVALLLPEKFQDRALGFVASLTRGSSRHVVQHRFRLLRTKSLRTLDTFLDPWRGEK